MVTEISISLQPMVLKFDHGKPAEAVDLYGATIDIPEGKLDKQPIYIIFLDYSGHFMTMHAVEVHSFVALSEMRACMTSTEL